MYIDNRNKSKRHNFCNKLATVHFYLFLSDIPTFENLKSGGSKKAPPWLASEEKFGILCSQIAGKWPSKKIKKADLWVLFEAIPMKNRQFSKKILQKYQNREVHYEVGKSR